MMLTKVREASFRPKGFGDENALLESMAGGCDRKRTAMIIGNYIVRGGPEIADGDPRLLGMEMLHTIELAARAYGKCVEMGLEPPTMVLLPNDIAPGIFQDNAEERAFKESYRVPNEIASILHWHGIDDEPLFFFTKDFSLSERERTNEFRGIRGALKEGSCRLAVVFESYAQNLAAKALERKRPMHMDEIEGVMGEVRRLLVPSDIRDSHSGSLQLANAVVQIRHPNGAPFCSFLAATLFREFESLGFMRMVNTFVMNEYPCVDKAAAAYKYMYGGRMEIRNIYLNSTEVVVDSTIR